MLMLERQSGPPSLGRHPHPVLQSKRAGGHHSVSGLELSLHGHLATLMHTGNYGSLMDDRIAAHDEHRVAVTHQHESRVGNDDHPRFYSHQHSGGCSSAGQQSAAGIGHSYHDLAGIGERIHRRCNRQDFRLMSSGVSLLYDGHWLAGTQSGKSAGRNRHVKVQGVHIDHLGERSTGIDPFTPLGSDRLYPSGKRSPHPGSREQCPRRLCRRSGLAGRGHRFFRGALGRHPIAQESRLPVRLALSLSSGRISLASLRSQLGHVEHQEIVSSLDALTDLDLDRRDHSGGGSGQLSRPPGLGPQPASENQFVTDGIANNGGNSDRDSGLREGRGALRIALAGGPATRRH
jgi:hypothetical protein